MRTIVDLPDAQRDALDAWCRQEGISRAEAVRRAIAAHVPAQSRGAEAAYGLWRGRMRDGLSYERPLREEWDVPAPVARTPRRAGRRTAGAKSR